MAIFGLDITAGPLDKENRAAVADGKLFADSAEIIGGDLVIVCGEHVGMGGDAQQKGFGVVGILTGEQKNA